MSALRSEAESLARALEAGSISSAAVIAWAGEKIDAHETPPIALWDLSQMAHADPSEIAEALRAIPGSWTEEDVRMVTLQRRYGPLLQRLDADRSLLETVVAALVAEALSDAVDFETQKRIYRVEHEIEVLQTESVGAQGREDVCEKTRVILRDLLKAPT